MIPIDLGSLSNFKVVEASTVIYDYDCRIRNITRKDIQALLDGKALYTTVDFGKRGIAIKLSDKTGGQII